MRAPKVKLTVLYLACTLCFILYVVSACGVSKEFQITPQDADRLKNRGYMASTRELEEGYKLYVTKCGNCHNVVIPSKYTSSEWQLTYLSKEMEKAKVEDSKEKKLITMFILSKAR